MNNSEFKTKYINIDAAINCYKRLLKASSDNRARHPNKHWERSRLDYQKMKTERPAKYKKIRKWIKTIYHNDLEIKQKTQYAIFPSWARKSACSILDLLPRNLGSASCCFCRG